MSARTPRTHDRSPRSLREDVGEPFYIHFKAVAGGTICALGVWLLLHALGLAVGLTQVNGGVVPGVADGAWGAVAFAVALLVGALVASVAGGRRARLQRRSAASARVEPTYGDDERGTVSMTSGARDAEIDEVWRELAELRRELRMASGHGASKVAR